MSNKKRYVTSLGVDFGSSSTVIVGIVEGENTPVIFEESRGVYSRPSLIAHMKNGEKVFFTNAKDQVETDGFDKMSSNLKENLLEQKGLEEAILYFKAIFDKLKDPKYDFDFSRLRKICFGHPAHYDIGCVDFYRDAMMKLLVETFASECRLLENEKPKSEAERYNIVGVSEPILAAYALNYSNASKREYNNKMENDDLMLVLDLGGHTIDIAIMKVNKIGDSVTLSAHASPNSIESDIVPMGKKITAALCEAVYGDNWYFDEVIDEKKCEFYENNKRPTEPTTPKYERNFTRVIRKREYKKFRIVKDSGPIDEAIKDGVLSVGLGDGNGAMTVNISKVINERLNLIINSYLENQRKSSIKHVFLTGGTARIPDISDAIMDTLAPWLSEDASGKPIIMEKAKPTDSESVTLYSAFKGEALSAGWDVAVALGAALVSDDIQGYEVTKFKQVGLRAVTEGDPAEELYALQERVLRYITAENEKLRTLDGNNESAAAADGIRELRKLLFKNK